MLRSGHSLVRLRCAFAHRPLWHQCCANHLLARIVKQPVVHPACYERLRSYAVHGPQTLAPEAQVAGTQRERILLSGFTVEEASQFQVHLAEQEGQTDLQLVLLPEASMGLQLSEVLQAPGPPNTGSDSGKHGRVVLLTGPTAASFAPNINELLLFLGQPPAIVAAKQPRHDALKVGEVLVLLREAHVRFFDLFRPLQVLPGMGVPQDARVVLNMALDAGQVPTPAGGLREDVSRLVVLDGLCGEEERRGVLAWLTANDHDHSAPPPTDKWELSCVDRSGDQPTWGLKPEMLQALQHDPPPGLVTIQSRLAALYPEFHLCHMPSDAFEDASAAGPSPDDGSEPDMLGSFVANAVMPGDPCHWHVDADPSVLPGESPWVQQFGWYVNREPARPLFVSAMLYLNEEWPEGYDAETMFMDPATMAGVFVRPAPGRIVLMDQDIAHRISPPSRHAPGPRYSLVWKLVLFPKAVDGTAASSIARPEWGQPQRFGSASGSGVAALAQGGR